MQSDNRVQSTLYKCCCKKELYVDSNNTMLYCHVQFYFCFNDSFHNNNNLPFTDTLQQFSKYLKIQMFSIFHFHSSTMLNMS